MTTETIRIEPARRVKGVLRLPGDKSISHRAALFAALARGTSRITNFASSRDCAATLRCLRRLGVSVEHDGTNVRIEGGGEWRAPAAPLDCENSGTTMRLLAGLLAWQDFESVLTGDDSLRSRPMRRVIEPLTRMGARVEARDGRAPLRISPGSDLDAITYDMPVASAQVKSCVLLAGLGAKGRTSIVERTETRDHTERLLRFFGAEVDGEQHDGDSSARSISIDGATARLALRARDLAVPGDISSAAFFIAAATMLPGSQLTIEAVGLNPTRTEFPLTLRRLGAKIEINSHDDADSDAVEPSGTIAVRGVEGLQASNDAARTLGGVQVARLIDELPMLAVLATRLEGGLIVRDAGELRVKETDRISATLDNLRRMGADVEEHSEGFRVGGRTRLRGAAIESYGDHRIAMAFAVAALAAEGASEIRGAEAVGVSFPEFFGTLESIVER